MPYLIEPMQLEDIPEVTAIERQSFTTPWPEYAYRREIKDNRNSRYVVVRWTDSPNGHDQPTPTISIPEVVLPAPVYESFFRRVAAKILPTLRKKETGPSYARHAGVVVGYSGLWLIHDEGHITTIAVRPDLRGSGLGELMLIKMVEMAQEMGADRMTLEVRASNEAAQTLYRKYTFKVEGVRRRYYSDDNEDALIMWSEPLASPGFQERFAGLRRRLYARLAGKLSEPMTS